MLQTAIIESPEVKSVSNGNSIKNNAYPGKFVMLPKDILKIDNRYQRDKRSNGKIQQYTKEWSWIACGALSVVIRGKDYYVVDGQHRLEAARQRKNITELPCLLFYSTGIIDEAKAFLESNTTSSAVTVKDRIKALLVTEDSVILGVKDVVESTGHVITNNNKVKGIMVVSCLRILSKNYAKDPEIFKKIWPLCAAIHHDSKVHYYIVG